METKLLVTKKKTNTHQTHFDQLNFVHLNSKIKFYVLLFIKVCLNLGESET